jgi:hypothetical protein
MTIFVLLLLTNSLLAQPSPNNQLKIESDSIWVEYALPEFMVNVTPEDYGSPHFFRYDFESSDKKVVITILVNNSSNFPFELKEAYEWEIKRKDIQITYKKIKRDFYSISGTIVNNRAFYQFCTVKGGYGYTYTIEYDQVYIDYFKAMIPEIVEKFKVLFRG